MFVSIFKPASQSARARFAFSPEQIMTMFGHKTPVKGDRLDIAKSGNKIRLTANAKGRFALSSVVSRRLPGCVTILASEIGMTAHGLGRTCDQTLDKKTKALTVTIPAAMTTTTPSILAKKALDKKATAPKAKKTAKTATKAKTRKTTAKRKAATIKATVRVTKPAKKTAAKRTTRKAAPKRQEDAYIGRPVGGGKEPAPAAVKRAALNAGLRPATTMLGDAVARLNKILAVTPTATVTTKNNRVLVTAERKIIVSYV